MGIIESVYKFNHEVVGLDRLGLAHISEAEKAWLIGVLREEAGELEQATQYIDQVDALIDSAIFAIGGLCRLGLTAEQARECFNIVMGANFQKRAGQKPGRETFGVKDAIKPKGWAAPEDSMSAYLFHTDPL